MGFPHTLFVNFLLCLYLFATSSAGQETAGNDTSDKQLSVPRIRGVFLKPIASAPFSGTVEIVSKQKLPDGSTYVLKTINYIARDSRGRTYNERRKLVAASYEKEPLATSHHIYDAVTNLSTDLDLLTHIARQTRLTSAPGPEAGVVPDTNLDPGSPLKQVDLGTRMFKGMVLQGTRQSSQAETNEYWYSPDLSIVMSRKHEDPIWEQTINVSELERVEPDPSIFAIPDGYSIVEVAETRNVPQSKQATDGVEILSDTKGIDFGPYMKQIIAATQRAWLPIIPEPARPPLNKKGKVGIRFKIYPNGAVREMVLEYPSGDISLDRAAWGGITGASPYPPLPKEFTGPFLELRFGFYYNQPPSKAEHGLTPGPPNAPPQ
jgi:TonB family protein